MEYPLYGWSNCADWVDWLVGSHGWTQAKGCRAIRYVRALPYRISLTIVSLPYPAHLLLSFSSSSLSVHSSRPPGESPIFSDTSSHYPSIDVSITLWPAAHCTTLLVLYDDLVIQLSRHTTKNLWLVSSRDGCLTVSLEFCTKLHTGSSPLQLVRGVYHFSQSITLSTISYALLR